MPITSCVIVRSAVIFSVPLNSHYSFQITVAYMGLHSFEYVSENGFSMIQHMANSNPFASCSLPFIPLYASFVNSLVTDITQN